MKINLKPEYLITNPEKLNLDCAIVLNGEDFNPPHVGLLLGNEYYSCTVNGLKLGFSFTQFCQILSRKEQKFVIFNTSLNLDKKLVESVFVEYQNLGVEHSCFKPVKACFELVKNKPLNTEFAYELIEFLLKENNITETYHFGFDSHTLQLEIPRYNRQDVINCINNAKIESERKIKTAVH